MSYFLTFLAVIFWIFRIFVAVMESINSEFICNTLNLGIEILIIFLSLPCLLLIIKRNLIGATLYLGMYGAYFGTALYNAYFGIDLNEELQIRNTMSLISSVIGVIIALFVFIDILFNKNRTNNSLNQKTDWYYNNDKFDREYDERADKNQYKIR